MRLRTALMLMLVLAAGLFVLAEPEGADILSNTTQTAIPQSAASLTTAGGSFTTLLLNATTQTVTWKAYVGNVTGSLTLRDAQNFSIYDWDLTAVSGEVYASRNNSVDWASIQCAQSTVLGIEESHLNISTTKIDSINRTFNTTVHKSFYVGTTFIQNSTCRAIATYVNGTEQASSENADFQEILLDDTQRMVYATILENDIQGYDNRQFDFQMILAENPTTDQASTYYFWVELT